MEVLLDSIYLLVHLSRSIQIVSTIKNGGAISIHFLILKLYLSSSFIQVGTRFHLISCSLIIEHFN